MVCSRVLSSSSPHKASDSFGVSNLSCSVIQQTLPMLSPWVSMIFFFSFMPPLSWDIWGFPAKDQSHSCDLHCHSHGNTNPLTHCLWIKAVSWRCRDDSNPVHNLEGYSLVLHWPSSIQMREPDHLSPGTSGKCPSILSFSLWNC